LQSIFGAALRTPADEKIAPTIGYRHLIDTVDGHNLIKQFQNLGIAVKASSLHEELNLRVS
jgi:hypothetical protein